MAFIQISKDGKIIYVLKKCVLGYNNHIFEHHIKLKIEREEDTYAL